MRKTRTRTSSRASRSSTRSNAAQRGAVLTYSLFWTAVCCLYRALQLQALLCLLGLTGGEQSQAE